MSKEWHYKPGDWYVTCDICGKKMRASKARHRWDGFLVCDADFEHRHPQDFLRVKPDHMKVPFSRPKETPTFVDVTYINIGTTVCTIQGQVAQADLGTADCAKVDKLINGYL
jgi:hypothetical protein